jgi:hypothetical protein
LYKNFILLLLISLNLFGANLTSYNIYPNMDKIDIMLSFDEKYAGKVSRFESDGIIKIKVFDIKVSKSFKEELNHSLIKKIELMPYDDRIELLVHKNVDLKLEISKTVDEKSLRVSIVKKIAIKPKQTSSIDYPRYFMVMSILMIIVLLLLYFKNRVENGKIPWLKKDSENLPRDFDVVFQKQVDIKNKVVLLSFKNKEYLVFVSPNSTTLLDSFENSKQEDFDKLLKVRQNLENKEDKNI